VSAGSLTKALAGLGINMPFAQSFATYATLSLAFSPIVCHKGCFHPPWKFAILAGIDVMATWCTVTAYSLTNMTSVALLDSWTVPCVMLLTVMIFKQRYVLLRYDQLCRQVVM
jgi:solute carrier family 35, member F1/2